jgi:hypothetical protein
MRIRIHYEGSGSGVPKSYDPQPEVQNATFSKNNKGSCNTASEMQRRNSVLKQFQNLKRQIATLPFTTYHK